MHVDPWIHRVSQPMDGLFRLISIEDFVSSYRTTVNDDRWILMVFASHRALT